MNARRILIHLWFGSLALSAASSLIIYLWIHPNLFFGIGTFLLALLTWIILRDFGRQPLVLPERVGTLALVLIIFGFLTSSVLSYQRGAPVEGNLPIFAERETYTFTRSDAVEEWRFKTVGAVSMICWHGFLGFMIADTWLWALGRSKPDVDSNPA